MNRANIMLFQFSSASLPWRFYLEVVAGHPLIEHFLHWWSARQRVEGLALVSTGQEDNAVLAEVAGRYRVRFLHLPERGELSLLLRAAIALGSDSVAVVPISLPLLPTSFLARLWDHHTSHGNALTEAADLPEGASPYIISSELLHLIADANPSDWPVNVRGAAHACMTALEAQGLLKEFRVVCEPFRFCDDYCIPRSSIPKQVLSNSREDFAAVAEYLVRACHAESDSEVLALLSDLRGERIRRAERQFDWCRTGRAESGRATGPLRILYVSLAACYSGAEESLVRMIAALDRERVEPHACVSLSGLFSDRLAEAGATVVCPESDFGEPRLSNVKYLMDTISTVDPHCVHLNGQCGPSVLIAVGLSRVLLVQHIRNIQVAALRDELRLAAGAVAVSEYIRRQVAESVDIDLAKVHVVRDGIDVDRFRPGIIPKQAARERLGIPYNAKLILMVARYSPQKRHDVVLRAFAQVRAACPEAELCFVGEAYNRQAAYFNRIQRMIGELHLERSVRCLGFQRDIRWIECAADVQILCSDSEPLGTAILESMALGVPVVISEGGGLMEIVLDGEHGFVVPRGDPAMLATRVGQLLADEAMRHNFGQRARRLVESNLTARHCADRISAIYESISRPRPPDAAKSSSGTP